MPLALFDLNNTLSPRIWLMKINSDSSNDLDLLEKAGRPVAVDADENLAALARQRGWACISLCD
ncbi:MAG: hypothetical protein D3916_05010 [Candidatus Electrothrix sp. MAN1_4]|nr:hypothetical protein [Candidatus Electrothrix sp. MAN1_4]